MAAKRRASPVHVECQNVLKSTQFFLDLVPTFLKKGALKLQKGGHFTLIGQFLVWETAHLPLP